jgi:predicted deacylase
MQGSLPWRAGEKVRLTLPVPGLDVALPATAIAGRRDGPTVLVTGGVHGGEYPGIEAAIRLARSLNPEVLAGRVLVVHQANPPAFRAKLQYLNPLDGKNLNRVFPGDPNGTASERMAAALFAYARAADAWIDLHGGDIHEALVPFTIYAGGEGSVAGQARRMAEVYGIPRLVESASVSGGTYAAAAAAGIPAILPEAGECGRLDEEAVATHLFGLTNALRALGVLPEEPEEVPPPRTYRRFEWVRAEVDGLWYRRTVAGAVVGEGDVVGEIRDVYGERLLEARAPVAGEVLFVVTSLAVNTGDPLFAVAAP